MALVKTIHIAEGPGKGGTVRVYDDEYAGISAEEMKRRRDAIALEIWKINRNLYMRESEALNHERGGAGGGPGGGAAPGG